MRKFFKTTLMALIATMTMATAGGDIAPIEVTPVVQTKAVTPFYVGAAYTYVDVANIDFDNLDFDKRSAATFIGGYNYNKYIGAEARYITNFKKAENYGYGIYVKPQLPVSGKFKLYALLGYAGSEGDLTASGFGYGAGASYDVTPRVFVFADYTAVHDSNGDSDSIKDDRGAANIGVAYRF